MKLAWTDYELNRRAERPAERRRIVGAIRTFAFALRRGGGLRVAYQAARFVFMAQAATRTTRGGGTPCRRTS